MNLWIMCTPEWNIFTLRWIKNCPTKKNDRKCPVGTHIKKRRPCISLRATICNSIVHWQICLISCLPLVHPRRRASVSTSRGRFDRDEKVGSGHRAGDQMSGGTWTSAGHPVQLEVLPRTGRTGNAEKRFFAGRWVQRNDDDVRRTVGQATGLVADGNGRPRRRRWRRSRVVRVHHEHAGAEVVRVERGRGGFALLERFGSSEVSPRSSGMPSRQRNGHANETVRLSYHRWDSTILSESVWWGRGPDGTELLFKSGVSNPG